MNPFAWLRNAARNAVIGGIQDAIDQVGSEPSAITVKVELPAIAGTGTPIENERPTSPARARRTGV